MVLYTEWIPIVYINTKIFMMFRICLRIIWVQGWGRFVAVEVGWWGHENSFYHLSTFGCVWDFLEHRVNMPLGSKQCLSNVVFHSCPLEYSLKATFPMSIYLAYLTKLKVCPILDVWIWTPEVKPRKLPFKHTMYVGCPHTPFCL